MGLIKKAKHEILYFLCYSANYSTPIEIFGGTKIILKERAQKLVTKTRVKRLSIWNPT